MSEDGLHLEIDAHRGHESRSEGIIRIAKEEGGLSHGRVADYQQLKHVVEVLIRGISAILTRHLRRNRSISFAELEFARCVAICESGSLFLIPRSCDLRSKHERMPPDATDEFTANANLYHGLSDHSVCCTLIKILDKNTETSLTL
jgi:hypothetical protein